MGKLYKQGDLRLKNDPAYEAFYLEFKKEIDAELKESK